MNKNRSSLGVMMRLIALVKPLSGVMSVAILTGCIGFFCAGFITVLGGYAVLDIINKAGSFTIFIVAIGAIAILRGVLHYIEQYCNHYIAFKLLAIIRDKVFTALRKLTPAKLEVKDKGNLVSLITSDVELLEVFYAHTVSPICIAFITSFFMIIFVSSFHIVLGLIMLIAHVTVGVLIPLTLSKKTKYIGDKNREKAGELNSYFLDSLRGLREILQFDYVKQRKEHLDAVSHELEDSNREIKDNIGKTSVLTNLSILSFSCFLLFVAVYLYQTDTIDIYAVVVPSIAIFSSFGAVTATANLGAGLSQTIASGNRVLDILDDIPMVHDVVGGKDVEFQGAEFDRVDFSYGQEVILQDFSLNIEKNKVLGISGKSGSGKSTALKLLMRFWEVQRGKVKISGEDIGKINTSNLRELQSFVTQETHIFHDTVENNIKIARLDATRDEVITACEKASVHDFIMSLPNGYDTEMGELGDTVSGGEKQRIGVARAFLHDADLMLLDEPTSNLDSLNEAVILNSLKNNLDSTVVLVSHRLSTMRIADETIVMESTRQS